MRRGLALVVVVAACGRINYNECCEFVGSLRCIDGVQQICHDSGRGCPTWGVDVSCSSGACLDDQHCTQGGNCAATPVMVTPFLVDPDAASCMVTDVNELDWQLAGLETTTIKTVDGVAVSGCVLVDFGSTCTPQNICAAGSPVMSACGDSCGGACELCGPVPAGIDVSIYVFASPVLDLEQFRLYLTLQLVAGMNTSGCGSGNAREIRYQLVCRAACAAAGWNVAVGRFQFFN